MSVALLQRSAPLAMSTTNPTAETAEREVERWEAVRRRDPAYDGSFLFGVLTTGVYCRPSCAARRPLRRNVRFYDSAEQARRDGLRACLRCRPDEPHGATPAWVTDLCEHIRRESDGGAPLRLADLARRADLSPSHLQRRFRAAVGVSPRQFAERCRLERLKAELRGGDSVTGAIYAAGFGSSSRVYERTDATFGMTPGEYRAGGRGVAISHATVETAIGPLLLAATDRGVCFVQLGGSEAELVRRLRAEYPHAELQPLSAPSPAFEAWAEALRRHLAGEQPDLALPLDVRASAFQQRVWRFLSTIPYGETRSYAEVAAGIGQPRAVRAVAQACASNPVAVAIPCHRVLRGDGSAGGYRWGVARKRALLAGERRAAAR